MRIEAAARLLIMLAYLLKRFALMAVTLLGIVAMTFLISRMTPGDPALLALSGREGGRASEGLSDESVRETRRVMGLDRPLLVNFRFENRDWHARDTLDRFLASSPGFWRENARFELGEINALAVPPAIERLETESNPETRRRILEVLPMLVRGAPSEPAPSEGDDRATSAAVASWQDWARRNRAAFAPEAVADSVNRYLDSGDAALLAAVTDRGAWSLARLMPAVLGKDSLRRDRAMAAARICANKPATWAQTATPDQAELARARWESWWRRARLRFVQPSGVENAANIVVNTQFGLWMTQFLTFDFGVSTKDNRPVIDLLKERLPVTLQLSALAIFLMYLLAIPLGVFSATHEETWADRILTLALFLLYSVPMFWLAQMLIMALADHFPVRGLSSDGAVFGAPGWPWWRWTLDRLHHLALPVAVETVVALAFLSRQMRVAMLETIRQDFIRTARAKGLSEFVVVYKHALRNSLIPILTLAADLLPALIGGSVIVESIFSLNGMGKLTFEAILNRNYPVVNCVFAFSALLTLVGILLADIGYAIVDPRIRFD